MTARVLQAFLDENQQVRAGHWYIKYISNTEAKARQYSCNPFGKRRTERWAIQANAPSLLRNWDILRYLF